MSFINVEIKARTKRLSAIRDYLLNHGAEFIGVDEQTDTYFDVGSGRLKLRQGKIENNLIYYNRPNEAGPKQSDFDLLMVENGDALRNILTKAIGIKIVVHKRREIYYIQNVKFHLDFLESLGEFVEIEASNRNHPIETSMLHAHCAHYMKEFGIEEKDLLNLSYSDMLVNRAKEKALLGEGIT